jgi:hypothetical protein
MVVPEPVVELVEPVVLMAVALGAPAVAVTLRLAAVVVLAVTLAVVVEHSHLQPLFLVLAVVVDLLL